MVKITDGSTTKTVTMGMFNNLYRSMGFKLVNEKKVIEPKEEEVKDAQFIERPKTPKKK